MFVQFAELPVFDQDRAERFYVDYFHCEVVDIPILRMVMLADLLVRAVLAETALHFLNREFRRRSRLLRASPRFCHS